MIICRQANVWYKKAATFLEKWKTFARVLWPHLDPGDITKSMRHYASESVAVLEMSLSRLISHSCVCCLCDVNEMRCLVFVSSSHALHDTSRMTTVWLTQNNTGKFTLILIMLQLFSTSCLQRDRRKRVRCLRIIPFLAYYCPRLIAELAR